MRIMRGASIMGPMRLLKLIPFVTLVACAGPGNQVEQKASVRAALQPRLPTGNSLDPAGASVTLGSFPLNAVLSPEGDRVIALLNGWREQGIQIVDRASGSVTQTIALPATFIGLAFTPDGRSLYVSGGNQDVIYRFEWSNRMATLRDSIVLAAKPDPQKS